MKTMGTQPARGDWMRYWTNVPVERIRVLAHRICEQFQVEDLEIPQSGLALVPLTDAALGETYYLGEIPLAKAHVRLTDPQGGTAEGAAIVMDDRTSLIRALAILDAVTAAAWPGHDAALELLREGERSVEATAADRKKLLAATRVDFALLAAQEDDDE
ncbi:alpha-D-ribose 1-methylphosphonate 5-triphosphate synthase subunit PhnG [Paraburkholderia sp. MM5496-R1]|uniref:phosphonate C-P lyase system protein PhnG n=1 Tax=unclassified Paraburkholderia TaxID=2615204 RepID=UPI003D2178FA